MKSFTILNDVKLFDKIEQVKDNLVIQWKLTIKNKMVNGSNENLVQRHFKKAEKTQLLSFKVAVTKETNVSIIIFIIPLNSEVKERGKV